MQRQYELMLLLKPDVKPSQEKKFFESLDKFIKDKGEIKGKQNLGLRKLAYKIKKQTEGNYWLLKLKLEGKEVKSLAKKFNLEEILLRYLFVVKE